MHNHPIFSTTDRGNVRIRNIVRIFRGSLSLPESPGSVLDDEGFEDEGDDDDDDNDDDGDEGGGCAGYQHDGARGEPPNRRTCTAVRAGAGGGSIAPFGASHERPLSVTGCLAFWLALWLALWLASCPLVAEGG